MTNHLTVMVGTHGAHHNRRCIWHSAAVHECNKQTVQGKLLEAVLGTKITSSYPSLCYKKGSLKAFALHHRSHSSRRGV